MHFESYKTRQTFLYPSYYRGVFSSSKKFVSPSYCMFHFLKDLFNPLIIDIRSIVCQRLVKISSIKVRKPPSSNKVHTSTRFSCNPVLGFAEIGRIINFTFVGNKATNLSFTGKTTISASWYGSRLRWRLKITANNENLSEDKLQNERKM